MLENRAVIPLKATPIEVRSAEFATICAWPFEDSFVQRLLRDDIRFRVGFGNCQVWMYRDPRGQPVGFGTFDVCDDYSSLVGGRVHPYIPLLGVNPTIKSLGYGTSILLHLVSEAAVHARRNRCADTVFLEVYTQSTRAIALYTKAEFQRVSGEIFDAVEQKSYVVMAKRVSTAKN